MVVTAVRVGGRGDETVCAVGPDSISHFGKRVVWDDVKKVLVAVVCIGSIFV